LNPNLPTHLPAYLPTYLPTYLPAYHPHPLLMSPLPSISLQKENKNPVFEKKIPTCISLSFSPLLLLVSLSSPLLSSFFLSSSSFFS